MFTGGNSEEFRTVRVNSEKAVQRTLRGSLSEDRADREKHPPMAFIRYAILEDMRARVFRTLALILSPCI